ncbi:hypothetical protein [Niallia nealsonii]|uniref:Uncharacterized protein n=1 Tax=Niallia nealsonii TaxID=115979 RepID=A0A2N0Z6W0_9BACI|nr:hypothetical protein [Niallia nealsonii]PKG25249.1 hypothetical protein CWS01_02525 [Niallia nealsonii]
MKKYIILALTILLTVSPIKVEAKIVGYDVVAQSNKENITLYAKELDGLYRDFKIKFKWGILSRPFWINDTSPTWSPKIIYENINQCDKQELIIILTKGYGTGVLEQEAHIFHIEKKEIGKAIVDVPVEVLIDNPLAIIMKNVRTQLTPDKAKISIGDKHFTVDIKPLGIQSEHLFRDISFNNIIKFEIKDNQFIAKIGGQISPVGGFIGEVVIVYEYQDNMYQSKSIKFQP